MRTKHCLSLVMCLLLLVVSLTSVSAGSGTLPNLKTLQPGGFLQITHPLIINVVFVGYNDTSGPRMIDLNTYKTGLPTEYRAVNRYPSLYSGNQYMGLNFTYTYNIKKADAAFENAFFGYLKSIAVTKPLTVYQQAYNAQVHNSLDVTSNNWIDAPSVEKWLAANADAMLGIDTTQYTVFLVNWFGRPDFMFHVYTKTGEPDPETGYDFGLLRDSRKLIAWGGTTPDDPQTGLGSLHRIWFYDLSAGPEGNTGNFNVDDADLDGNGVLDYRMPPTWEYGNTSGYRPFTDLSGDLSKVTRYVAVDLLFTPSPLYKPVISPPKLPEKIEVDISVFQGEPGVDATQFFDKALIAKNLNQLQPDKTFSVDLKGVSLDNRTISVLGCFASNNSCFGNRLSGIAFGDLFLYFNDHLLQYVEGDADYEVPVIAFNTVQDVGGGLLGFADDNWRNGTQSFIFGFDTPETRQYGYGFTTTVIHETGHHLGMSHPHDGFDYQANVDYGPGDQFFYAWSGDESNSMMSYIDLNWEFGQFDRDSMNRYLVSGYLNQANVVLNMIAASPRAGEVSALLSKADINAGNAVTELQKMNYLGAESLARTAYWQIMTAADQIQVQVEPQSWQADYKAKGASPKFVDRVDYHRNLP